MLNECADQLLGYLQRVWPLSTLVKIGCSKLITQCMFAKAEYVSCSYIYNTIASPSNSSPYRPIHISSARHDLVVVSNITMATILESGIPATVQVITNGTQHGVSSRASGILSAYLPDSNWKIAVTALLVLIAYDQCMSLKPYQEL